MYLLAYFVSLFLICTDVLIKRERLHCLQTKSNLLLYHLLYFIFFCKGTNNCKIALPEMHQD